MRDLFVEAPANRRRVFWFALGALLLAVLGGLVGLEFLAVSLPMSGMLARMLDVRDYRQSAVK